MGNTSPRLFWVCCLPSLLSTAIIHRSSNPHWCIVIHGFLVSWSWIDVLRNFTIQSSITVTAWACFFLLSSLAGSCRNVLRSQAHPVLCPGSHQSFYRANGFPQRSVRVPVPPVPITVGVHDSCHHCYFDSVRWFRRSY